MFLLEVLIFDYILPQEMGLLEVKHGLLQIAETLDFLHNNAHLIHRAISPEVISYVNNLHFIRCITVTCKLTF